MILAYRSVIRIDVCPSASEMAFWFAPAESAVEAKLCRLSRARDNGHILLGHTPEKGADRPDLPKTLAEAEAEAVALLCVEALGLPGADYARGYIQLW